MSEHDPLKDPVKWAQFRERQRLRFQSKEEQPLTPAERLEAFRQRWPERRLQAIPPDGPKQPMSEQHETGAGEQAADPSNATKSAFPQSQAVEEPAALR